MAGGPWAAAAARGGSGGLARPGQCGGAHWRVEVATPLLAMAPSGGGMAGALRAQKRVQKMVFQDRRLKGCVRQLVCLLGEEEEQEALERCTEDGNERD